MVPTPSTRSRALTTPSLQGSHSMPKAWVRIASTLGGCPGRSPEARETVKRWTVLILILAWFSYGFDAVCLADSCCSERDDCCAACHAPITSAERTAFTTPGSQPALLWLPTLPPAQNRSPDWTAHHRFELQAVPAPRSSIEPVRGPPATAL